MIREVTEADLPEIRALNEAAVPHVNSLPLEEFNRFRGEAAYFRVACEQTANQSADQATIVALLVAFLPGADYVSENYRWFGARYGRFIYIDRIIVAPRARGAGVARALYGDLEAYIDGRADRMTCEVNIRPPNQPSAQMHQRLGFVEVGQQDTDGGRKRVSMLCREFQPGPG